MAADMPSTVFSLADRGTQVAQCMLLAMHLDKATVAIWRCPETVAFKLDPDPKESMPCQMGYQRTAQIIVEHDAFPNRASHLLSQE